MLYFIFLTHSRTIYEKDVDYSYWLGEGNSSLSAKRSDLHDASMVAPNHMGFMEGIALCAGDVHPGFAPKVELKRLPVVGKIFMAL
jgi:hypothetical protein